MGAKDVLADLTADGAWKDMLLSVALAIALAAVCHALVAEARFIPSGSMRPTLAIGDRVLIEKLSYRFGPVRRGDIVVFQPPEAVKAFGYDNRTPWIKRVVALSGERIRVIGGKVYVNGQPLEERYLDAPPDYTMAECRVPAGDVFVLGDNRNHSIDSHVWGPLPMARIVGRASWRFWPFAHFGELSPDTPTLASRVTGG